MARELGPTGLRFATDEDHEGGSEPTSPGMRELDGCVAALGRRDYADGLRLATEAAAIFATADLTIGELMAEGDRALCLAVLGRPADALACLEACENRLVTIPVRNDHLEGMVAFIRSQVKATWFGDHEGAAVHLERARVLGTMDRYKRTDQLLSMNIPSMASATAVEVDDQEPEDPKGAIHRLAAMSLHLCRHADVARAAECLEEALEIAREHVPTDVESLQVELIAMLLHLDRTDEARTLYDELHGLGREDGPAPNASDSYHDVARDFIGVMLGDAGAAERLAGRPDTDTGLQAMLRRMGTTAQRYREDSVAGRSDWIDLLTELADGAGDETVRGVLLSWSARERLHGAGRNPAVPDVLASLENLLGAIRCHDRARQQLDGVATAPPTWHGSWTTTSSRW